MKKIVLKIILIFAAAVIVHTIAWGISESHFANEVQGMQKISKWHYQKQEGAYTIDVNKPQYPCFTGNYCITDTSDNSIIIYHNGITGSEKYAAFLYKSGIEGEIRLNKDGEIKVPEDLPEISLKEYEDNKKEIKEMLTKLQKSIVR